MIYLKVEEVQAIKVRLWEGYKQESVADEFQLSQSTISRIVNGQAYPEIPWPDGSLGPISDEKYRKLLRSRKLKGKPRLEADARMKLLTEELERRNRNEKAKSSKEGTSIKGKPKEVQEELEEKRNEEDHIPQGSGEASQRSEEIQGLSKEEALTEIDRMEEQIKEELDRELEETITRAGPSENVPIQEAEFPTADSMDWDLIRAKAPDNPYVVKADESDDDTIRQAICIVFKAISPTQWDHESTASLIAGVASTLKGGKQ